jgi:hypothetical protein
MSVGREFGSVGDIVYELALQASGKMHFITASRQGAQCEGFFADDDGVSTVYTASTVTLTSGKFVCRLTIRSMR